MSRGIYIYLTHNYTVIGALQHISANFLTMKTLFKNTQLGFGLTIAALLAVIITTPALAFTIDGWMNLSFGINGHLSGAKQNRLRIEQLSPTRLNDINHLVQDNSREIINKLPAELFAGSPAAVFRSTTVLAAITSNGVQTVNYYNYLMQVRNILLNSGELSDFISRPISPNGVPPTYMPIAIEIVPSLSFSTEAGFTFYKYFRLGTSFSYTKLTGIGYESSVVSRNIDDLIYGEFFNASSKISLGGNKTSGGLIFGAQIGSLEKVMAYLDYGIGLSKTTFRYGRASIARNDFSTSGTFPSTSGKIAFSVEPNSKDKSIDHLIRLGADFKVPLIMLRIGGNTGIEFTESGNKWFFLTTIGLRF